MRNVIFITENSVDYTDQVFAIKVYNESYRSVFIVNEMNCFKPHPENSEWTVYQQKSEFKINIWLAGYEKRVQESVMEKYLEGYDEGRKVDEEFVQLILNRNGNAMYGYLEHKARLALNLDEFTAEDAFENEVKSVDPTTNTRSIEEQSENSNQLKAIATAKAAHIEPN